MDKGGKGKTQSKDGRYHCDCQYQLHSNNEKRLLQKQEKILIEDYVPMTEIGYLCPTYREKNRETARNIATRDKQIKTNMKQ